MVHSTAKAKAKRPARGGGRGSGRKRSNGVPSRGRMPTVKEVVFDDDARREYLTGFSKRKKEKKEAAKERAVAKEKAEKLEMRKQIREARKEQAAANVAMAKQYYGEADEDEEPEAGTSDLGDDVEDREPQEQEFENEEMTSRVVIQEMRLSDDEDGEDYAGWENGNSHAEDEDDDEDAPMDSASSNMFALLAPSRVKATKTKQGDKASRKKVTAASARSIVDDQSAPTPTFATNNDSPEKKPAKRFTYETKAARRAESLKQKVRRIEKAEGARSRSGGKTGRGAKAGGKRKGGKQRS